MKLALWSGLRRVNEMVHT